MAKIVERKRVTLKHTRPNPLFQSWLQELYEEAVEKDSKLKEMLKEALESISKYPLPLQTGRECAILKGFGKELCAFLDTKLAVYNSQDRHSDIDSPQDNSQTESNSSTDKPPRIAVLIDTENIPRVANPQPVPKSKSPKRSKAYKPAFRSGGYAILIALLNNHKENPNSPSLRKEELMEKAQEYSEESFKRPKPGSHYTAWSNMARLISKDLVNKVRRKTTEFSLTSEGMLLAQELLEDNQNTPTVNDIIFNDARTNLNVNVAVAPSVSAPDDIPMCDESEMLVMLPGSFEVVLLIDKAETSGLVNQTTCYTIKIQEKLSHHNITYLLFYYLFQGI